MPTINGIKMACAPCIRGHRSTKCNHADERLMVPVRKPGRPLSVCPHPQDQACGCGSVTAAIPRKQKCGCGESSHPDGYDGPSTNSQADPVTVQAKPIPLPLGNGTPKISAQLSPVMEATPGIQKPNRPQIIARKLSYDMGRMEKLEPEGVNTRAFDSKIYTQPLVEAQPNHINDIKPPAWNLASQEPNTSVGQMVGGHSNFENISPPINAIGHIFNGDSATPPIETENKHERFNVVSLPHQFQGYTRQLHQQPNGVIIETRIHNVGPNGVANINGHWVPQHKMGMVPASIQQPRPQSQPINGGERSCCSSKRKRIPEETPVLQKASNGGSCCSSKRSRSISSLTTQSTPSQSLHLPPPNNQTIHANHIAGNFPTADFISQPAGFGYMPQPGLNGMSHPTVFAYPPTYGSHQHPLQPAQWRQGVQYNTYAHMISANPAPPNQGQNLGVIEDESDTLHSCACGDGCECIGCAAHPYNEATQKYVRSAWETGMDHTTHQRTSLSNSMSESYSTSSSISHALVTNGKSISGISINSNGISGPQASSPAGTPSDTAGDDPPLSASDFFFVNYPFSIDGCGGDTQSCPCGDDCACLGCSIHNSDPILNAGDKSAIPALKEGPPPEATSNCCGGSSSATKDENRGGLGERRPLDTRFEQMCAGDESTCPCPPDGCYCIGCIIHGRT